MGLTFNLIKLTHFSANPVPIYTLTREGDVMSVDRLPTQLWVDALVRRANVAGAAAFIVQRGDGERGDVLVKVADMAGQARLYRPRTNLDGQRVFINLSAGELGSDEVDIDTFARKACDFDTDLWLVEIEDRALRAFITESIEE